MYQDYNLTFSQAQAITATTEATNYVDALALGDAELVNVNLVVSTDQAFASADGTGTLTISLYTSSVGDQADVTLYTSPALTITQLNALAQTALVVGIQVPRGILRYLGLEYTVGTESFTAGHVTAFLTYDSVQTNLNQ